MDRTRGADTGASDMPKMKTHSGAKKRFKKTKSGKIKHRRKNRSHILTKKSSKRKRGLGREADVDPSDVGRIRRMLPYGPAK